jgi:DNA replication licensing factor MCM2
VQLTDPILTRFDVLCVMRDEVDPVIDAKLAEFVVRSHVRSHPIVRGALEARDACERALAAGAPPGDVPEPEALEEEVEAVVVAAKAALGMSSLDEGASAVGGDGSKVEPIPQELLRKYIVFARSLKPSLTNIDQERVALLYTQLRKESEVSNGVPIAVRHIESIMRISEAAARMRLSPIVSDSDLNLAIRTMLESFVSAQKAGVQRTLRNQFGRYLQTDTNNNVLLLVKLRELVRKQQAFEAGMDGAGAAPERVDVAMKDFLDAARVHGITEVDEFLKCELFRRAGFVYDAARRLISRTF